MHFHQTPQRTAADGSSSGLRLSHRNRRSRAADAFTLILACTLFSFPSLWGAKTWLRIRTSNFELLTSAREKDGKNLLLHLEKVRSFFIASMGRLEGAMRPVRIIGFSSAREFEPYRPNEFATAFYSGGPQGDFIVMKDISPDSYPVAIHEYVHLLIRHTGMNPPPWWNEGQAELFSTLTSAGSQVEVGSILAGRFQQLKQERLIDLRELVRAGHDSPLYNDKHKAAMFYAESWALVHMLNLSEEYRPHLREFMRLLGEHLEPEELFQKAYGKTLPGVQQDLESYLNRRQFNAVRYGIKLEKSAETPEASAASGLEVELALATILISDKPDESRRILEGLNRSHPESSAVEESLGYLFWYQADREGARTHLGRAIEKGAASARTYVDYTHLMQETHASSSLLIPIMERAAKQYPDDGEVGLTLASLYLSDGRYAQALAGITGIGGVPPDRASRTFTLLAYCYLGLGDLTQAKAALEKARSYARSTLDKGEVERLARSLANVEQSSRRSKQTAAVPGSPPPVKVTATGIPPTSTALKIRGVLIQIDCLDAGMARVIAESDGRKVALLIEDPGRITIEGKTGGRVDFDCGPQPRTPVRITYEPIPNEKFGTAGRILTIEFIENPNRMPQSLLTAELFEY
jgi:tetratricopeptide (TPR) repeat protein